MNILITILARKGSKGVPNKHTRLIAGKPLIWWTTETAINWRMATFPLAPIAIGSDSDSIFRATGHADIPRINEYGRSPEHTTDAAPKVPAIREVVFLAEKEWARQFDVVIDLDATAPIRTTDDIDGALALFQFKQPDCVMSCTVGMGRNPYFNLLEMLGQSTKEIGDKKWTTYLMRCKIAGTLGGDNPTIHNRQEAPDVFEANSSIYVYSRDFLMREDVNSPLDGVCIPYVMPDESYYHVDSELDFAIVDFLLKRRETP